MKLNPKLFWTYLKLPYWFFTGWGIFWLLTFISLTIGVHKVSGLESLERNPKTFALDQQSDHKAILIGQGLTNSNLTTQEKPMTFNDLATYQGGTPLEVDQETIEQLYQMFPEKKAKKYINQINKELTKLNERWQSGAKPADFLTLGDFQDSMQLQNLSIGSISELSGQSLDQMTISQFSLLQKQNLGQLVKNVPGLKEQTVGSVPFIQEAMKAGGYNPNQVSNLPIGDVMETYPQLGKIGLGKGKLEEQNISEIPGIEQMSLGQMSGWQQTSISSVPGLANVPINQLGSQLTGGVVGQIHFVLSDVEKPSLNSISGSYQAGFAVPCQDKCAHIELGTNPLAAGKQWISGREDINKVDGGEGILKVVFGGREPTGRHPFGKGFKVVVWNIDESQGTVETAWFFRVCKKFLGCTPYGFGPIPGFVYKEGDWIFLGVE